ncbi:sugar MFS transporter [uncultured Eubacterium sp.]|uniref:MFS transporter n=1 Tax=uncultured Eubacterium sp. TaxID=165185 RepID=UPI0015A76DE7|nr:MFS transporter [uncultured Eubacterium sp.]
MKNNYKQTINACFVGYIVQAIVNNFAPLLFVTFRNTFGIPLSKITLLISLNFIIQLTVDLLSARLIDKIGYRTAMLSAHLFSGLGLILLAVLPYVMNNSFAGLLISVIIYAVGGGILEVLVSPIVEACPTDNKEKAMSLLHSFYCWGHVLVVLVSTLFFTLFGIENWRVLAIIWALIPICNAVMFTRVPIAPLVEDGTKSMSIKELLTSKLFIVLFIMMICSGASEQAVSQWASTFAMQGLGVTKTVGDLAGPLSFAALMGTSRAIYGKFGDRLPQAKALPACCLLCVFSYLLISLSPIPALSLIGCGICGFSVGIMWPGTFSLSSSFLKNGGTAMFALLALGGDLGCTAGPAVVGFVSYAFSDNLKIGILLAIAFPLILLIFTRLLKTTKKQ